MQIREKLLQEGIRVDTDYGQQKVICPKCSHTRRNKREPCLSINIENDLAVWHCHHCEWKGSVHENVRGNDYKPKPVQAKNVVPFVPKERELSQEAHNWLNGRRISPTTYAKMGIYSANGTLCFPYYLDGDIVNVKHRTKEKRFYQEKMPLKLCTMLII